MADRLGLAGKVAVITGATGGWGTAAAIGLAERGAAVVLNSRSQHNLEAMAAELRRSGATCAAVEGDIRTLAGARSIMGGAVHAFGTLDILVNAAGKPGGQAPPPKLGEITDALFWDDVNVKVMGYLRMAREAAPHMASQGWGRIINISGLAARSTGSTIGSIRNVAVAALTKNLADELGPQGINVTVVHPGLTRTEKTASLVAGRAKASGKTAAEVEAGMAANVTIGRLVDAAEIADIVAFLASPRSVAINGDAIACGGGTRGAIHY